MSHHIVNQLSILHALAAALLFMFAPLANAACPAPTPGSPHVCLTWTAPSGGPTVAGYNVYRATTAGGESYGSPLNSSPVTTTQFYDTSVTVGTTYFYTVCSVGTGGQLSTPSSEVSAQVPIPPNPVTAITPEID